MPAIQEAVDKFCYRDPREPENKPFFPQPDELISAAQDETESMKWRIEFAQRQVAEMERLRDAPKPIEAPKTESPWESLSKPQVSRAVKLVLSGKSSEEARDIVLEEDKTQGAQQ